MKSKSSMITCALKTISSSEAADRKALAGSEVALPVPPLTRRERPLVDDEVGGVFFRTC